MSRLNPALAYTRWAIACNKGITAELQSHREPSSCRSLAPSSVTLIDLSVTYARILSSSIPRCILVPRDDGPPYDLSIDAGDRRAIPVPMRCESAQFDSLRFGASTQADIADSNNVLRHRAGRIARRGGERSVRGIATATARSAAAEAKDHTSARFTVEVRYRTAPRTGADQAPASARTCFGCSAGVTFG